MLFSKLMQSHYIKNESNWGLQYLYITIDYNVFKTHEESKKN